MGKALHLPELSHPKLPAPKRRISPRASLRLSTWTSSTSRSAIRDSHYSCRPGCGDRARTDHWGGHIPEPELDRLSNILANSTSSSANEVERCRQDSDQVIAEEIPAKVAADKAYQNAMKNSDKQNARIEHDRALQKVIIELVTDHTELFKQFSDNPTFKKWLRRRSSRPPIPALRVTERFR